MNRQSVLTKTAKGLMEATGKTSDLARDLRNLLKEIDGKVTVGQLQMRQELFTEVKFMEALKQLELEGYVREQVSQPSEPPMKSPLSKPPADSGGSDLDFTAIASRTGAKKATDISQQIAGERDRVEAAAKAKAEFDARAKKEAEEQARRHAYDSEEKKKRAELDSVHREADERNRKAAEEKAKREAEERAKREAAERAKREAEEKARHEAEEKARRAAEEKARREAEERSKREAEERRRREAEEKERREAEERRRRKEEEERRRREDEEREKREAAERARREEEDERRKKEDERRRWEIEARAEAAELEEQIRREREAREAKASRKGDKPSEAAELEAALRAERAETEERVRRENEERVRREEEERRRHEEEQRLRPAEGDDADEEIRRREEEMHRREQEEAARAKQEAKVRAEADAKAAAEVRAREKTAQGDDRRWEQQERAKHQSTRSMKAYRPRRKLGRPVATALFFILVLSAVAVHFVPFDSTPYERAAQEWLGQPVRIGTVNIAFVPSPHLRFEKVTIGKDPQMRIATARAAFTVTSIFDERKILRRIEIDGSTVPQAFLGALVSAGAAGAPIGIERVTGKGVKLEIPGLVVPEMDVDATLDSRGGIASVRLSSAERGLTATLEPRSGRAAVEIAADKFVLPIGGNLTLDEFSAKGTIGRTEAAFSQFEGRALNGTILGNARLRWADGWSLDGEFSVRQMDAARIASPIVATGKLEGKGVYGMKATAPDKLLEAARMDGHFTIQKGSITNVDMTRILQGSSTGGGTTLFSEMSADARADAGRIQVRQLRLAAGLLQAAGSVDLDAEKNLSGRVQIELRAQTVQARATLAVSGSLQNPQFRRAN